MIFKIYLLLTLTDKKILILKKKTELFLWKSYFLYKIVFYFSVSRMREMGLFWETIKHLFSTILQVLWAAVYRQIQQTWEGTHEQLRYCLNFQIYTSRIKGRATNFWCFLGRAILFREKTGRATNICPKTWTGDKKIWWTGDPKYRPSFYTGVVRQLVYIFINLTRHFVMFTHVFYNYILWRFLLDNFEGPEIFRQHCHTFSF